jgi:HNH endonuclease
VLRRLLGRSPLATNPAVPAEAVQPAYTCGRCHEPTSFFRAAPLLYQTSISTGGSDQVQALLDRVARSGRVRPSKSLARRHLDALVEAGTLRWNGGTLEAVTPLAILCPACYEKAARSTTRARIKTEVARIASRPPAWQKEWGILQRKHELASFGLGARDYRFECAECGRWAKRHAAAKLHAEIIRDSLNLSPTAFGEIRLRAQEDGLILRPAFLEKEHGMSYENAVAALEAGVRSGVLVRRERGFVPGPPICDVCLERRQTGAAEGDHRPIGRDAVPPQLRFRVLQRDGFRCQYCGRSARDGAILHLDHVVPFSAGGETTEENLISACDQCNLGKSARPVLPGPPSDE